jgi:hypothetical protein
MAALEGLARRTWLRLVDGVIGATILGVAAPLAGLALASASQETELALGFPMPGAYVVAGMTCVLAFALSLSRRGSESDATSLLAGACACGALLALPFAALAAFFAVLLAPTILSQPLSDVLKIVVGLALVLVLAAVPCALYSRRAETLLRAAPPLRSWPQRIAPVAVGFLAPLAIGTAVELGLRRLERGVIERHVLAERSADVDDLAALRPFGYLRRWPELWKLTESTSGGPAATDRGRRARVAYTALTDFEF